MLFKYVTNIRISVRICEYLTGIRISIHILGSSCTGIRICIRIRGASSAGIRIRIRIRGYANFDIRSISNLHRGRKLHPVCAQPTENKAHVLLVEHIVLRVTEQGEV